MDFKNNGSFKIEFLWLIYLGLIVKNLSIFTPKSKSL